MSATAVVSEEPWGEGKRRVRVELRFIDAEERDGMLLGAAIRRISAQLPIRVPSWCLGGIWKGAVWLTAPAEDRTAVRAFMERVGREVLS